MAEKKKDETTSVPPTVQEDIHPDGTKATPDSIIEARRPLPA